MVERDSFEEKSCLDLNGAMNILCLHIIIIIIVCCLVQWLCEWFAVLHFSFFQEKATNKAASSSALGDKKGNKCYLGYPWLNLWATYPPRMKDLMIEWFKKNKLKSVLEYYNVVRWFFFSLSVMHCKQHKLSRWALFALRANVVINIVYIKKKLQ